MPTTNQFYTIFVVLVRFTASFCIRMNCLARLISARATVALLLLVKRISRKASVCNSSVRIWFFSVHLYILLLDSCCAPRNSSIKNNFCIPRSEHFSIYLLNALLFQHPQCTHNKRKLEAYTKKRRNAISIRRTHTHHTRSFYIRQFFDVPFSHGRVSTVCGWVDYGRSHSCWLVVSSTFSVHAKNRRPRKACCHELIFSLTYFIHSAHSHSKHFHIAMCSVLNAVFVSKALCKRMVRYTYTVYEM